MLSLVDHWLGREPTKMTPFVTGQSTSLQGSDPLYILARVKRPNTIVEFDASYGIFTYLSRHRCRSCAKRNEAIRRADKNRAAFALMHHAPYVRLRADDPDATAENSEKYQSVQPLKLILVSGVVENVVPMRYSPPAR